MSSEMMVAALAYAKRGWPVFPCAFDKRPVTKNGVMDATTDPKRIEQMWETHPGANIGLHVGEAGMMVLDLDPGHSMEELENNVGKLPDTALLARTPRGGQHLYFALDEREIVAPSASKLAPHVDVRSFHSFVLLPPSRTKDGAYRWAEKSNEGQVKPAYRTDEMLRLSNAGRERHKDHDTWLIEADLPENVALCTSWLRGEGHLLCHVAVEGQGGDQTAYNTAAMCKSFGVSQECASELMWKHWNPRCVPPWSADEYEHFELKIENGYRYNTSPPGHMTPAYKTQKSAALFETATMEDGGMEYTQGRFRMMDRDGADDIRPPQWLVKDFLPTGSYAMIYGKRGTYKTFLALDIALTVAAGMAQDTVWTPEQCGAVCFAVGEGRSAIMNRVRAWEQRHFNGMKVQNFYLMDPVPGINDTPEDFMALLHAARSEGWRLLVIDTLGRALQGVNENAQEVATAFTALVELIQRETGATVLVIHHAGKDDARGARGSSVFGADVDTEVRATSTKGLAKLAMTKQKDAPEWEKPKVIKLQVHKLDMTNDTLVATIPTTEELAQTIEEDPGLTLDIIGEVVYEYLFKNNHDSFSTRALAEAVAMDDRIDCGSSQLRQRWLKALREDSKRDAKHWYFTLTQLWHISKPRA